MRAMRAAVSFTLVLGIALAGAAPAVGAEARAVAQWSMIPQAKDANGDGIIDGDGGVPRRGALSLSPSTTFVGEGNRVAQPHERLIGGAQ